MDWIRYNTYAGIDAKLFKNLDGMKIAVTGSLSIPRDELRSFISILGGELVDSVSFTTNVLVVPVGGSFRKGTKWRTARDRSVEIVTEAEFVRTVLLV